MRLSLEDMIKRETLRARKTFNLPLEYTYHGCPTCSEDAQLLAAVILREAIMLLS